MRAGAKIDTVGGRVGTNVTRGVQVIVALFILTTWLFASCAEARLAPFCAPSANIDYSQPLEEMREVDRPSYGAAGAVLNARGVAIQPSVPNGIAVGGGGVGFLLEGKLHRPAPVGWSAVSTLRGVNRHGKPGPIIRQRTQRIGAVSSRAEVNLAFVVGARPRFYRVDIDIRQMDGTRHARYADYFRVVPRLVGARLGLEKEVVHPGDVLLMRLENVGTIGIEFGYEFDLKVRTDNEWTTSPAQPAGWPEVGLGLGAGRNASCERVALPSDIAIGSYRVTKRFGTSPGGPFKRQAQAFFSVQP